MPNGKNGNGKKKPKLKLTDYDKGYRDGYLEGLNECGPLAGFTQWWGRRTKTQKLGDMKEAERMAIVRAAVAEYESLGAGTKQKLLENPSKDEHKVRANTLAQVSHDVLKRGEDAYKRGEYDVALHHALSAAVNAGSGIENAAQAGAKGLVRVFGKTIDGASELMHKIAGVSVTNPASQAGAAAIGGLAGGILLGPLGAALGGYGAVKGRKALKKRATEKKRKGRAKKNPSVGRLVSSALK